MDSTTSPTAPPLLPASLASLNTAAVAAAKGGRHDEALQLYERLFKQLQEQHLTHRQLFITHSNKAACHLALGQHAQALQDAKQCLELLTDTAASAGLSSPSKHPHWSKACLRLGQAFAGLGQHQQAAAAFEAGLAADPLNAAMRSGLQLAQQGLAQDLLSGKTLAHIKALPAPVTPERITLAPHNAPKGLRSTTSQNPSSTTTRFQRRGHQVGWQSAGDTAGALIQAADMVAEAAAGDARGAAAAVSLQTLFASSAAACSYDATSWQLPKQLLTPAAASADASLRDVYEYLSTQCAIRAPKHYLYRTLPDAPRMLAWWTATSAAVTAVRAMGRVPRVLLLGAKAGVLAVAALRAGAQHVTCVESCPYLAAACQQVLVDNGCPQASFSVICTPSPATLKLGPRDGVDVPNVCNCLVADMLDDGVLSAGLVPAVAHALEELLVREGPVTVPRRLTVMAHAVGLRPSVVDVEGFGLGGQGGSSGVGGAAASGGRDGRWRFDLTALDRYRWTPSQALPAPMDPDSLIPLSCPQAVWHLPLADMVADRSAVQHLDVELTGTGSWCAVAFWAELHLFGDIHYSTAGPWSGKAGAGADEADGSKASQSSSSQPDSLNNSSSSSSTRSLATGPAVPLASTPPSKLDMADETQQTATTSSSSSSMKLATRPAVPLLLLTYPQSGDAAASAEAAASAVGSPCKPMQSSQAGAQQDKQPQAQSKEAVGFAVPPSHQPALCWLPGALPVAQGDIYPLVASHNTVRCMFTIKEADYSFLFEQDPSFPHSHFNMVADQHRLSGYAAALRQAVSRAAAAKQAQQANSHDAPGKAAAAGLTRPQGVGVQEASSCTEAATIPSQAAAAGQGLDVTILDVGCGTGVLSLLAAATLASAPRAPSTGGIAAAGGAFDTSLDATADDARQGCLAPSAAVSGGSVIGMELAAPLAAVAQRAVAANGAAGLVSILQADAASCRRGQQVPLAGADIIMLDVFDAGLIGHGALGLVEAVKSTLAAAADAQVIPASACMYCMGLEVLTVSSWDLFEGQQQQVQPAAGLPLQQQQIEVHLEALERYRWSDQPDTVQLHQVPHRRLTAPIKLADFDLCAPAGTPYPKEMGPAQLEVVAAGRLTGLVVWFDLHLAEGVSLTSAPLGFTTGGLAACDLSQHEQQCAQHHWGQALHHLGMAADVKPGDVLEIAALREGPRMSFELLAATRTTQQQQQKGSGRLLSCPQGDEGSSVPLQPALRPPWLRPGAGIEDPAVWSVKKSQQLLGQMLMRAPGAKFPPIWKDLLLMQVHAGSLGLCAATVGAVTQELTMREALSVASQKQLLVSPFAVAEAAGTQPPVVWR